MSEVEESRGLEDPTKPPGDEVVAVGAPTGNFDNNNYGMANASNPTWSEQAPATAEGIAETYPVAIKAAQTAAVLDEATNTAATEIVTEVSATVADALEEATATVAIGMVTDHPITGAQAHDEATATAAAAIVAETDPTAPVTSPLTMRMEAEAAHPGQTKARKIQVDLLMSPNAAPPSGPKERDIIFCDGGDGHVCNLLLQDLIALHKLVWEISHDALPETEADVDVLTERLFQLMKKGKGRDLAGMKDVPRSFLVGSGRFMQRDATGEWKELSDDEAKKLMRSMIFTSMQENTGDADATRLKELGGKFHEFLLAQETEMETHPVDHKPSDIILLQTTETDADKSFNHLCGNKSLFLLASQHVQLEVRSPSIRLESALSLFLSKSIGGEVMEESEAPRFILCQTGEDGRKTYSLVKPVDAAEVTLLFVFEVWLEKEMAAKRDSLGASASAVVSHDDPKPSTEPIETPTPHDVLFGRGGMTNSHPGNKRFRDVIALHRPDYIKAIKNDKPNVARRIVRAIRTASPPGRFLKKNDDGFWYDVGNRIAAEKASQALREKSNAEKRERSAQREAMRGKKDGSPGSAPTKKSKIVDAGISIAPPLFANQLNYVGAPVVPTIQNPVDAEGDAKSVKIDPFTVEFKTDGLPPNAVDKDGNILVTDWDILAGRGGLTNHHRGNKRFRDIVALHRPDYIRAPKVQKPSVARVIVRAIRNGDPPGRFLKKDEKTGKWYDIGDKKAAEKTSQALREKGNEKEQHPPAANGAVDAKSPAFLLPAPTEGTADVGAVPPSNRPVLMEGLTSEFVKAPTEDEALPNLVAIEVPSEAISDARLPVMEPATAVVSATTVALNTAVAVANKLPTEATMGSTLDYQEAAKKEKQEESEKPQTVVV